MKNLIPFILLFYLLCSCQEEESSLLPFKKIPSNRSGINFSNDLSEDESNNILEYLYFYNGSGVAVEDLNNDGLPDIYFGANQKSDQLYLNQGDFKFQNASHLLPQAALDGWTTGVNMVDLNDDGWMDIYVCRLGLNEGETNKLFINQAGKGFKEEAKLWGLDITGYSTQSSFFDYDNDGDLDCYLLKHSEKDPDQFKNAEIRKVKDELAGDLLLENTGTFFIDMTEEAKIYSSSIGFGLGVSTADINNDGWVDIYVGNDFHEQDYLYINNKDKTFTDVINTATGHTSNFSMGCSIEDLNNDAKLDVLSLDMKPYDDDIYKKSGGWENMQIYNYKRRFGYHHQSPRNALQINETKEGELPYFSEQACYSGIEATDWSWSPMIADFDNDGDKDLYITNGILRRPNDMDFINFEFDGTAKNKLEQLAKIPSGKIENFYFECQGSDGPYIKYLDAKKTATTAAAYADFNLDGKIDLVLSNLNEPIHLLKNINAHNHFLQLKLISEEVNRNAVGSKVTCFTKNGIQTAHLSSSNGFLSHSQGLIHFGFKDNSKPDSILISWPDQSLQKIEPTNIDTLIIIKQKSNQKKLAVRNQKDPCIKVDAYKPYPLPFKGQKSNKWLLFNEESSADRLSIHNNQLKVVSPQGTIKGIIEHQIFIESEESIFPDEVLALVKNQKIIFFELADQNLDGIDDYFIQSDLGTFVLISSKGTFLKIDLEESTHLKTAAWGNVAGDEKLELVIAGLWMPISIINFNKDHNGKEYSMQDLPDTNGWWSKIKLSDLNKDGYEDIIAGNFGLNHSLDASNDYPIQAYESDFDRNGSVEKLITYYYNEKEVPYPNQQLFVDQLPYVKKNFLKNEAFVKASISELIGSKKLKDSKKYTISELRSCCFIKEDKWIKTPLPSVLQLSPIYAIEKVNNKAFYFGGNLFDVDPNLGRQDANMIRALIFNNGKWLKANEGSNGISLRGEIRSIKAYKDRIYFLDRTNGIFSIGVF